MKEETLTKLHRLIQKEAPKTNSMIVVSDDTNGVATSLSGDASKIGQAIYTSMFSPEQPQLAKELYIMVGDIVYNIIKNPSEMADKMIGLVRQAIKENEEAQSSNCKIVPLIPHGEA
jgi:hypothetical protein